MTIQVTVYITKDLISYRETTASNNFDTFVTIVQTTNFVHPFKAAFFKYQETKECKTLKTMRLKRCVCYYRNTDATFNVTALSIKLSGDDHPLPGPDSGSSKIIPVCITNRNDSYRPNNQLRSYTKSNTFRQKRFVPRNYITIKPQAAEGPPNRGNQNTAVRGQHHCIKVYHLNVRSIKNRENFKQVRELINPAATHSDFDVFTISESWLD